MRVGIRRFKETDAQAFYDAVVESVEHVSEWLPWCTHSYSLDEARKWMKTANENWLEGTDYRFAIEDLDSGKFLGSVGINHINLQHKIGNLGYWVRKSALGSGVCTQAARKAIACAFSELDLKRLEISVHVDNQSSNAVAAKLGGVFEGILRNKLLVDGRSLDAKCYSIIPADYL